MLQWLTVTHVPPLARLHFDQEAKARVQSTKDGSSRFLSRKMTIT